MCSKCVPLIRNISNIYLFKIHLSFYTCYFLYSEFPFSQIDNAYTYKGTAPNTSKLMPNHQQNTEKRESCVYYLGCLVICNPHENIDQLVALRVDSMIIRIACMALSYYEWWATSFNRYTNYFSPQDSRWPTLKNWPFRTVMIKS